MVIGNRKEEGREYIVLFLSSRKSPAPSKNSFAANLNQKKLSLSLDLNPACSERIPLLYRLRHHLGPFSTDFLH